MNSFGQLFRVSIFGESHGDGIGVVIDGCPPGLPLKEKDFFDDLKRRRGEAKGSTPRREADIPVIKSGVFNHKTTGAPVAILFANKDARPLDYLPYLETPRPGHADFVTFHKYGGFNDPRGGGHFSGRVTLALVAAGVIAKKLALPAKIKASLIEIGGSEDFEKMITEAEKNMDSVGGIIECRIANPSVGLGEPFFDSMESLISHLVFAVPGIKGIEFGSGFACSRMFGSECNDILMDKNGRTRTNHSGGINGGISNGNDVVFRVAVRPTPSIRKEQETIHVQDGRREKISIKGRHDICFALRMPVIVEAAAAIVFADLLLRLQTVPKIWGGSK
jgi:chorismate synthase